MYPSKPFKHNESAAYIDKNGDLIFTSLGDKQNALCVKDRSSINTHAVAESYRPQILCNRQCAKCSITYVNSQFGGGDGHWIITTCGVQHHFDRLYIWRDGEYNIQLDMERSITQEEWDAQREAAVKAVQQTFSTLAAPIPPPKPIHIPTEEELQFMRGSGDSLDQPILERE